MKTNVEHIDTECPAPDELRQLLDGTLSGDRQQACTTHMDTCTCCQAKLENIATDGSNLSQVVEGLNQDEPVATSAYWPALKSLSSQTVPSGSSADQITVVPQTSQRIRDLALDFLHPPSDPVYLGRLAHFDVMRMIGRGGMGVVFEAFDSKLQRHVALKVLDPELMEDEVSRQRFCREARAAASITHENVVAVHQVEKSTENGLPYLVMQLISGESLEQRLSREKQLPIREIVRISMQAAHGLAAAHGQGLIHRDIKPGNILLESVHDSVKLTDFGLARVAEDVKLTRTGFVSGTPLYMSPEQAMGDETDHRSDLFSLGAIMYEMCAGQPPFAGNSALAILKQIADTKHKPLREVNPSVPSWLAETIDDLLAKKPGDRIQSAAHLAELLEFEWALMKTSSDDVPIVCQIEQRKRRIRYSILAVIIGATFLTLGLLGGYFFAGQLGGAKSSAGAGVSSAEPVAVLSANAGAVWGVSISPKNDTVAMGVEDGSIRIWNLASKSIESTFNAHRGTIWIARYSPDGNLLATSGDDNLIKLWKPGTHEPIRTFPHANAVRGLIFSQDGRQIFAGDRNGLLRIWSVDSDKPLLEAQQPGTVLGIALSPNNETLATGGSDKVVRLWNAKNLTQRLPLEGHAGPIYSLSFHPDGRRLVSVGWDKTVRIWDTASGQLLKSWTAHDGDIWSVAFSPDGTVLATGGTDNAVKLWDTDTGELRATYVGHRNAVHGISFSPDGSLVASGSRDGSVCVWPVKAQ